MDDQPKLSEAEWELVIDLLHRERNELPTEIHHTDDSALRLKLRERRRMVQRLLHRLPNVEFV